MPPPREPRRLEYSQTHRPLKLDERIDGAPNLTPSPASGMLKTPTSPLRLKRFSLISPPLSP